jgi:CRP-like cAMP-binding protein
MSRAIPRTRSNIGRVAVPVADVPARPSLVPADVWTTWQDEQERARATVEERSDDLEDDLEIVEVVTSGFSVGLAATIPADYEVALLALQQVTLFRGLDRSLLESLARSARQGEVQSGDYLFREDAYASSFFVVLDGAVEVLRRTDGREVALRHLERGEPVGLFGLFSGQRRAACARAIGDAVLLEIPGEALNQAIAAHDELRLRIIRLYEARLLEAFLGTSRLFADVDSIARARLIGRFEERRLRAGENLVTPGEVSNLVAVVIAGRLVLELRPRGAEASQQFELYPGEFLAQTSAFTGTPCRTRISASGEAVLMLLSHRALADLLRDQPAHRAMAQRLPSLARRIDRDVWCGTTGVTGL